MERMTVRKEKWKISQLNSRERELGFLLTKILKTFRVRGLSRSSQEFSCWETSEMSVRYKRTIGVQIVVKAWRSKFGSLQNRKNI